MNTKSEKQYVFKPMKTLTPWTLGLIVVKLIAMTVWTAGQTAYLFDDGLYDVVEFPVSISALLYILTWLVSGVVSLFWIYGAARNVKALRPTLDLTPGWAVGWFFVPFANLVKPCTVMGDIAVSSKGPVDGRYPKPSSLILLWWLPNIFGNIITSIAGRFQDDETLVGTGPAYVAFTVGLALIVVGTAAFFKIVRDIHRDQLAINMRLATVF
jgi:hypothetical protein